MEQQQILILAASLLAGLTVLSLTSRLDLRLTRSQTRALADYVTAEKRSDPVERVGEALLRRLPLLPSLLNLESHRRWLELAGAPSSPAYVVGLAALLGGSGLTLALLSGVPLAYTLVGMGLLYPFARLRNQANSVRRRVQRALPELSALMAAEMAAGNPPDKALERAGEWGGPLSALVRLAVGEARRRGRPLFGRGDLSGVWTEVVGRYDLTALRAFAAQIDMAARKGAAGPELMEGLARTLIIEYKDRALREAEALDSRLAVPSVLLFFMPFLFLILTPLLMPVLNAF